MQIGRLQALQSAKVSLHAKEKKNTGFEPTTKRWLLALLPTRPQRQDLIIVEKSLYLYNLPNIIM